MADNSYELFSPPYLNHPRTCPKNTNAYLPEVLSSSQQSKTDNAKIKMARHNQKYLGAHPEIKAIVSLILRNLFIHRPVNIHEFVGEYVRRKEFPDEIAQFIMERHKFKMPPEEEEEEGEPKATESPEATAEETDFMTDISKVSGQGDHKYLKRMLYGVDSQCLRHTSQSEGSRLGVFSYDQLLKLMRSSTSTTAHSMEETTLANIREAPLEEEDEEDEDELSRESSVDDEDNEEALLEGQRLIFAMLGKTMTPSPSGSDISMLKKSSQTKRHAARHAAFVQSGEVATHRGSHARASLYSENETVDQSCLSEADEDEEYFEKD